MLTEMAQTLPEAPTLGTNCIEIPMPAAAPVDLRPIVPAAGFLVVGAIVITAIVQSRAIAGIIQTSRTHRLRPAMAHENPRRPIRMTDSDDIRTDVAQELIREGIRMRAKPGFYLARLVPHGPLVAIWVQQDEHGWRAIVDGNCGHWHPDPAQARGVDIAAMKGQPCAESEYRFRLERNRWASQHDTDAPEAKPLERYDPATARPIF